MRCWQRLRLLPGATEAAKSDHSLLSKKSSKKGLTRRPLFLVRVDSLICTVGMIGPSRSVGAGRDALPRVRRCMSHTLLFAVSANALLRYRTCGSFRSASPVLKFAPSLDVQRRIARERVPAATASANQIVKPEASSPRCSLYDPLSGSNPRLICLTNLYFGHPVPITITSP